MEDKNVTAAFAKANEAAGASSTYDQIGFGLALHALRCGRKMARTGWNGNGLWVEMQVPDANSKMTLPYLFLSYPGRPSKADPLRQPPDRDCVPWLASQTDMLALDWYEVEDF